MSLRLGFASRQLENSVNSAVNGTFFELGKDKAVKGGGGVPLHQLCSRHSGTLTPTTPRLWETITK